MFNVTAMNEIRKYNEKYKQIKVDYLNDIKLLVDTRIAISKVIDDVMQTAEDGAKELLDAVLNECNKRDIIPIAFSEEYYIKMLLMIMIYKAVYCDGGL